MLKQHCTLARIASWSILTLCLGTQTAGAFDGFTPIYFDGKAAKWNKTSGIQIDVDPDFGTQFSKGSGCDSYGVCTSPSTAIQRSINAWTGVSGINLNVNNVSTRTITSTPHYDGKNQIKFYSTQWETLPFAPPSSALAVTITTYGENGNIEDADIFMNGKYFNWAVVDSTQESSDRDIQNVITHELGHFFGLDHSSENASEPDTDRYAATMFFASFPGETSRQSLEAGDMYGIQHIYTSEDVDAPSLDSLSPNQVEVSYKGTVTIEFQGSNFLALTSVILARNSDDGDVIGRVVSVEDDRLTASFDVSNMQSGQYDVVIANSYNQYTRMEKAFSIQNNTVVGTYNNDDAASQSSGGCHSNGRSSLLLFLLPLLAILPRRIKATH